MLQFVLLLLVCYFTHQTEQVSRFRPVQLIQPLSLKTMAVPSLADFLAPDSLLRLSDKDANSDSDSSPLV